MRNLIRSPLTWMVAAELCVVVALVTVAWNVVASANRPSAPALVAGAPPAIEDSGSDLPLIPQLNTQPARGPLPGLNVDSDYWRRQLVQLNADQAFLEQLEWRIVRDAELAAGHYVETVVVPAVRRAEQAEGAVVV